MEALEEAGSVSLSQRTIVSRSDCNPFLILPRNQSKSQASAEYKLNEIDVN